MAEDVSAGKGRKDEVEGDAEVIIPAEINRDTGEGAHVQQSDDLKGAERFPRLGNEEDKPISEALGD